ncbi:MAG: glucose-inhibited division protein A [Leptolyngbya sp. LCM1.Bin17]|nr:MAG: glucose-inhibited division protein A [Leptolyngbya sp. LCM1.Bin17]
MDRSKFVAVITGVISLLLAIGYLVLVQLLDFRGEMMPAPLSSLPIVGLGRLPYLF